MDRLSGRGGEQPPHFRGRPVTSKEAANANEYFEPFLNATTLKSILGYHRSMCEYLHLKPNVFTHFYPKLRANLNTWRAKALWKKFDTRAAHKCYGKGKICAGTKVLIIGGGPCGLRTAIEAQLLGAKVVVVEKRDRLSRNNVLHLWPFVIEDLRMLGAKKFFGKFCAGSIDHISIRQLQCVLLKAALLLGVELHTEVSFERLIEPSATEKTGWRAEIKPADHPVSQYEFDVIIGADGKRNTLEGFKRKEFRGKLAIAITANFINKKSEAEAQVEEISGVAFIFNQKFFKDLQAETRIDLENIVYYKDDTHYFVMTAKKASLLEKGVIKQDLADTEKLLAPDNVDREALQNYARQAADFSTNYKLPDLDFAVNHYGQPDVAMFDFTSMYAAEYASKVTERNGHRLLMMLVGDSLLEPFWPTGSGCARGFLSALDAAWAIRSWSMGSMTPLDVLAERESIYRLLAQTTPDNLNKDWKSYTLDPATRYPNLNKRIVQPIQTTHQYDTDNQENIEKMKRASSSFEARNEVPKKRRRGNVDSDVLLAWLSEQLRDNEDVKISDLASVFKDGKLLCAIIHHYRPDLLDYHSAINDNEPAKSNQLAIDILEKDLGIPPIVTGEEITNTEDYLAMASYLTQVYDTFRGEIPHIKHPKLVQTAQDGMTDITSVTRQIHKMKKKGEYDDIKVEERTDCIRCEGPSSEESFMETLKRMREGKTPLKSISKFSPQHLTNVINSLKSTSAPPAAFSVILESEENELPVTKRSELSFKTLKTSHTPIVQAAPASSRPSSRHKRHADAMTQKANSIERKNRKRRTLERVGPSVVERQKVLEEIEANRSDRMSKRKQQRQRQTDQFLKSMQMLQANAKPDHSQPFEDYSIFLYRQTAPKFTDRVKDLEKQFTYIPDHDNQRQTGLKPLTNTNAEEDIASKIRSLEDRWTAQQPAEKKPKDLMRAIGKIETSDWNIKEIEKKILENKIGKPSSANRDRERVPRWSNAEFRARQTKMEKKHLEPQDSVEEKYAEIDKNIKHLELKLKEGTSRDLGQNKVATITEKLVSKVPQKEVKERVEKSVSKVPLALPMQSASENCHFCGKRVYLMERLSAEGRFFHNGCFKCQYCHTQLRLGSYSFDRDGHYGYKFFCTHHYGMQGELPQPVKLARKQSQRNTQNSAKKSPDNKALVGVKGVDLLDRVQTPERIEFANLSAGNISSDHEEPLSQMDEDEWTDKNFGASCAELDESDEESSSSLSDTDSDDEDAYDDAMEEPATKEGTMKWAERWKNSYRKGRGSDSDDYSSSDHSSYYENSSDDSDSETATEGEEEIRARELRQQEVRVLPPVVQTDTGTDTEVVSDESSSESSSEVQNSATEISTDSEFAQDEPTPTREIPSIVLNDFNVTKTRGSGSRNYPRRIHVTTGFIGKTTNNGKKPDIELKLTPLVPKTFALKKPTPPLLPRTEGYALNRTQSTGGIAAKVSLELKKRYLLGESGGVAIQKSGSASTLDTKFKSFQSTISDCQKLLKPAPEISASMQVFCSKLDERHSPILSPKINSPFFKDETKGETNEKPLPPPDITITTIAETKDEKNQNNDPEERPRSPIHEASISVPDIRWKKSEENQSSDSLSDSNSSSDNEPGQSPNFQFENIPTVEVHTANDVEQDDIPLDSLCPEINNEKEHSKQELRKPISLPIELFKKSQESNKSVSSEKKSLNQPKSLPNLENTLPKVHKTLHVKVKEKEDSPDDNKSSKTASGKSTPDGTAALTETELSDWARDGNVSDDIGFDFSQGSENIVGKKQELDKIKYVNTKSAPISNTLETNLDSIEFMDTGTETSSDDGIVDIQNGYVLFKDEDDLIEDSLNPNINEILEAKNIYLTKKEDDSNSLKMLNNTGFCIADTKNNQFGSEVIDLKPADLEKLKQKQSLADHEEDSLLVIETGTTTEENTCSDSTVKNITEIVKDSNKERLPLKIENFQKQRLEDKLAKVKAEAKGRLKESNKKENVEFEEHCQRLQSKIEFSNAKDSIDIRKSRRKSKTDIPIKPDLIQEEKEKLSPTKDITLNLSPVICAPEALYKKENIKKERDVNQKLIQEMVMNKMKAENKSLERKKRNRTSASNLSPSRPYELTKSLTSDSVSNISNLERNSRTSAKSGVYATPDLLSNSIPLQNSQSSNLNSSFEKYCSSISPKTNKPRPLSVFSTFTDFKKPPQTSLISAENSSMPDIRKNLFATDGSMPKAPPRYNRPSDITRTAERLKETARARARLLSNEDLGLSPEDRLNRLKDKFCRKIKDFENIDPLVQESIESLVLNTERRNSLMYSNDTLTKKKNNSFKRSKSGDSEIEPTMSVQTNGNDTAPTRTKSIPELPKKFTAFNQDKVEKKICKSDSNLLKAETAKPKKEKKIKDRERRRSITKLISNIFSKKSPPGSKENKGIFSRLSPKSKPLSKSCTDLDRIEPEVTVDETDRRKSLSEINIYSRDPSPPPVPPLPTNYTIKGTDDSSDGDQDWRRQNHSSCDTPNQSSHLENSTTSLTGRKSGKVRRVSRQSQLKRHRMAQEIQRKLEETEVKTRELEMRGVDVEKMLRGEGAGESAARDEAALLQEWFDLMRDRTELRRYEKELTVRAQELELEDRHSRLQTELRERLESNENKTEEDVTTEEKIINEMMDIVAQRDSLIAVLEEDRLRYSNEDRGLEEQMLAEGLRLTPIRKTSEK